MKFTNPTVVAKILNRYKRFLSDIELDSGEMVHAHVPNTGSMKTCWGENWKVLVSKNDDPKRKMKYTLELTHNGEAWICVNTGLTNKIVKEALEQGLIPELATYKEIKPEKKVFESRIDFFLSQSDDYPDAYVEVKNVTLKGEGNIVLFPDSVTTRGQKHLRELILLKEQGYRACMLYIVNREDGEVFMPASEIDPEYARLLVEAQKAGVEILVYKTNISTDEITLGKKLEYKL
jgi:sugar fermentation stimulation protein A